MQCAVQASQIRELQASEAGLLSQQLKEETRKRSELDIHVKRLSLNLEQANSRNRDLHNKLSQANLVRAPHDQYQSINLSIR